MPNPNFEQDMRIDELNLHDELARHSQKVMEYVRLSSAAQARAYRTRERLSLIKTEAKKELELARSRVEGVVRRADPGDYDLDKFTEATIQMLINTDPEYQEAQTQYAETIEEALADAAETMEESETLRGAVDTMGHRRAMLEGLVKLFLSGYYSEITVDRDTTKEVVTRQKNKRKPVNRRKGA